MPTPNIRSLFANAIDRRIEEVIKVDQNDEEIIREEISEYVVTDAIRSHFTEVLDAYRETPNKPHESTAIWVSGFFGSGKSSFAKMLGLSIENRSIAGIPAGKRFADRAKEVKLTVLLKGINENIPTHAVIFDVSTDRGIRSGNQKLTEIMYGLFLHSLGYAKDLDLAQMEIDLEGENRLEEFEAEYYKIYKRNWSQIKEKIAFALGEASRVMHSLKPDTYPMADSWVKGTRDKADITPGLLAERANELMKRRRPGQTLLFVVDEVGQFVARDADKMLDLQAIVESLGKKGRGKHWLVVTSQEQLGEVVSGLDGKKIELAKLMDRFRFQYHLEPSDISEVTSQRVLSKNASAEKLLGELFDTHRGRFTDCTRLSADIRLPELTREQFIALYPLLPYQVDLIIQVVSGLRMQGGASRHVGGANRTIIKLAQQLLINPVVGLADQPVGAVATLDQVYDLVESNIGSEIKSKIAAMAGLGHPLAQRVAKVICLLQFVPRVHRIAENIAATLHNGIAAESQLAAVREALRELEATNQIRLGDDGYRIPTPAEDDWDKTRNSISARSGDIHRLYAEILSGFWQPQPQHNLGDAKTFKGGLTIHGRDITYGALSFDVHLSEEGTPFKELTIELRLRSQVERGKVFWAIQLTDAIDREAAELFRSKEILVRKEREARTADQSALVGEEKVRLRRHQDDLRRLLKAASLSGSVSFRGNDRSPEEGINDMGKAASAILSSVLPDVFNRFKEAAAKGADVKRGLDALLGFENLQGLPSVFGNLSLLRDERGKTVFRTESGPLQEVLSRIEERASYGDTATGRSLAEEFEKEPFGWDFEALRLLVLCLLRAGKIQATSKGQTIDSATSQEAHDTFTNNNFFRQASFRPKKSIETEALISAADAFKETFGTEVRGEITNASAILAELRGQIDRHQDLIDNELTKLRIHRLPGTAILENALDHMKAIQRESDDNAIATFNSSHRAIKEANKRAAELEKALTEPHLHTLSTARRILNDEWRFLRDEPGLPDELRDKAMELEDILQRETFYRSLPTIDQSATAINSEFNRQYDAALESRTAAYRSALERLSHTIGWDTLDEGQKHKLEDPLNRGLRPLKERVPIPQLRSDLDACESRLRETIAEMHRIIDGERIATVQVGSYFSGGIETEEQLEAALGGIREECSRLIGAGKKIIAE